MHPTCDTFYYKGIKIYAEWYPTNNLPKGMVHSQVYGVCFKNDGKILINRSSDGLSWSLPGGKPEKNEIFSDTLIREVDEESSVDIWHPKILGYVKSQYRDEKGYHVIYQLRCAAMVRKVKKLVKDSDSGTLRKRRFINPKNFEKYIHWGRIGKEIMHSAKLYYEKSD